MRRLVFIAAFAALVVYAPPLAWAGDTDVLRWAGDPEGGAPYVEANSDNLPLLGPVTVAADKDYAYVGDAARGQVIRYKRRQ